MGEVSGDTKRCRACGEIKPLSEFYKDVYGRPFSDCKSCNELLAARRKRERTGQLWSEVSGDARQCNICGETKPLSEFYRRGDGSVFSCCTPCDKARSVSWLRDRREWLRSEEEEARERGIPLDSKECYVCGEVKPVAEYRTNRRNGKLSLLCAACRQRAAAYSKRSREENLSGARKRMRDFFRARKAKWKEGRSCQLCGEGHPACLDFHHRDPHGKDFDISHAISIGMSDELIAAEIAKCDVLCRNCHTKLHWEQAGSDEP